VIPPVTKENAKGGKKKEKRKNTTRNTLMAKCYASQRFKAKEYS
jgi:hypothetical protein